MYRVEPGTTARFVQTSSSDAFVARSEKVPKENLFFVRDKEKTRKKGQE